MYHRSRNGRTGMGLLVTVLALLASGAQAGVYSGGSGAAGDPYQISTLADWNTLSATPADWSKYCILTADIDCGGAFLTPIGNFITRFTGVLHGNGHVIRNGQVHQPLTDYVGLFGVLDGGGKIRNLGVENITVAGAYNVGGLLSVNLGGTVSSCYTTGAVTGVYIVGGLVGLNASVISSSYATGTVTGAYVGGLLGTNLGGTVTSCYATGAVVGKQVVGGLVGDQDQGTVISSYWNVTTSGRTASAGGEGRTTDQMTYPYAANTYVGWNWATVWLADVDYSVNAGYPYLYEGP